jgi:hypothetical protein
VCGTRARRYVNGKALLPAPAAVNVTAGGLVSLGSSYGGQVAFDDFSVASL